MRDARDEVAALEDARFKAMREQDWPTLDRLFSEALVYTHSSGVQDGKASYLAAMQEGIYRYFAMDVVSREVRLFGDTALAFSQVRTHLESRGLERRLDNKILAVWIRENGQWRFVAYQPTAMPPAPATASSPATGAKA